MRNKFVEQTLLILKPDAVQRGLVGEIIARFEKKGLKIVAMKMIWPDKELAVKHYYKSEEEKVITGGRTIASYKARGIELKDSPIVIAERVQKRLVTYLTTGPVIAFVLEGAHAIDHVRKIRGNTSPLDADVGTITADYTVDSYFLSDPDERSVRNLVHASGSVAEAEREISIWFNKNEIHDYSLAIDKILYSKDWEKERKELVEG